MRISVPEISKQIYPNDIRDILENKYDVLGPLWVGIQLEWMNDVYVSFKDHEKFISYFKNISSLTLVDIPNQINAISGMKLKEKLKNVSNLNYKESIEQAIKSLRLERNDIVLITGSIYLAGEVLRIN